MTRNNLKLLRNFWRIKMAFKKKKSESTPNVDLFWNFLCKFRPKAKVSVEEVKKVYLENK